MLCSAVRARWKLRCGEYMHAMPQCAVSYACARCIKMCFEACTAEGYNDVLSACVLRLNAQVALNYKAAKAGNVGAIIGAEADMPAQQA